MFQIPFSPTVPFHFNDALRRGCYTPPFCVLGSQISPQAVQSIFLQDDIGYCPRLPMDNVHLFRDPFQMQDLQQSFSNCVQSHLRIHDPTDGQVTNIEGNCNTCNKRIQQTLQKEQAFPEAISGQAFTHEKISAAPNCMSCYDETEKSDGNKTTKSCTQIKLDDKIDCVIACTKCSDSEGEMTMEAQMETTDDCYSQDSTPIKPIPTKEAAPKPRTKRGHRRTRRALLDAPSVNLHEETSCGDQI